MAENKRLGHRTRLRDRYFQDGVDALSKRNMLELFLSLTVPQKDVKRVLYGLMNKFPTLNNIFSATYDELMSVEGMNESSAMSILAASKLISRTKSDDTYLDKPIKRQIFAHSIFKNSGKGDKLGVVCMTSAYDQKCYTVFDDFDANDHSFVSKILQYAVKNSASTVYLIYYTPEKYDEEVGKKIDFLCDVKFALKEISVQLVDFIFLSNKNSVALSNSDKLCLLFN